MTGTPKREPGGGARPPGAPDASRVQPPADGRGADDLRRRLLAARDGRAGTIARLLSAGPRSVVFLSLNIPGPNKTPEGSAPLFRRARAALLALPGARPAAEGHDALGPWLAATSDEAPDALKRHCVELEETLAAGRLLDLDVYAQGGTQVDRASLGLRPRRCLVCEAPAVECIRLRRHEAADVEQAVRTLLGPPHRHHAETLASALVDAARAELALTPKPGLVDARDNGSHPDLSYDLMSRSIDLLPQYFAELLDIAGRTPASGWEEDDGLDLDACIEAGRRAEERMLAAVGSNTHRGYIFLGGLVLLGAARSACDAATLQAALARLAARILRGRTPDTGASHGDAVRQRLGLAGIHGEARRGLPSVFQHGLPALRRGLAAFDSTHRARHLLMAVLMSSVEDTTALHRCGREGLERLRRDGRRLQAIIERGEDYLPVLSRLNEEYRAMRLTMGGVADCMAVTIALHQTAAHAEPLAAPGAASIWMEDR